MRTNAASAGNLPPKVELRARIFEVPQLPPAVRPPASGAKANSVQLLGVLTEQQARRVGESANVSTGTVFSTVAVNSGRQAIFDLKEIGLSKVKTDGDQLTVFPSFTEFLGYDDPADTDWATGGPYAPPDRGNFRSPFTKGPRFSLRQKASTVHLFDGQTVVVGPLDASPSALSNSLCGACVITVRLLDEDDRPIRTPEELQIFKTVPQQPSSGRSDIRNSGIRELITSKTNTSSSSSPTNTPSLHTRFFRLDPANLSFVVARDPKSGTVRRVLPAAAQTNDIRSVLQEFFKWAGADFDGPGKTFFLNEKNGLLMIRGTISDIEAVQSGVALINTSPPQLTIEVKATEVPIRAIRDKSLRLPTLGKSAVVAKAGEIGSNQPASAAASVITRSQFADVLRSLSDVPGADVLSMRAVTTMSGRQAQIKVVDVRHIVTDVDITTNAAPGKSRSWWPFGRARDKRDIRPISEPFEFGPVIDVVPTVEADGYTITMTVLPTLREFLGYDDPGTFQVESGGTVSPTPLPKFRIRQVATSARVWDGQTLVIGAGQAPAKDGTPRELIFFITPRLIDPAGNPVHREDDLEDASVPAAPASGSREWADPVR